jgi:uncharacterized protein (DUF58 family)
VLPPPSEVFVRFGLLFTDRSFVAGAVSTVLSWVIALLCATVPLALGAFVAGAQILALGVLLAIVAALALDWRATPPPRQLDVRREHESRLSIGAENAIRVLLANRSRLPLLVQVRDEYPSGLRSSKVVIHGCVAPGATEEFAYTLWPPRRGDFRFGDVNVRYQSALGLFIRQARYPAASIVKVYPNLLAMRQLDIMARRSSEDAAGLRVTRHSGQGSEFERLRDYQPDDEERRINWKATARRGKPVSMEYEAERSQNLVLMLDSGRLMLATANDLTKLDHALNTALLLAHSATRRGDRFGLVSFADRVELYLPPRRGRRWLFALLDALHAQQAHAVESDFNRAFAWLAAQRLRRSLVVLFTDVAEPAATRDLVANLARVARHHLVVCVTLADPALATPATRRATDSQGLYEKAVAQRLLEERRDVLYDLRARGVVSVDVPSERLLAAVRYLSTLRPGHSVGRAQSGWDFAAAFQRG